MAAGAGGGGILSVFKRFVQLSPMTRRGGGARGTNFICWTVECCRVLELVALLEGGNGQSGAEDDARRDTYPDHGQITIPWNITDSLVLLLVTLATSFSVEHIRGAMA